MSYRFISPESNVLAGGFDTGSGLVGYNVYAYCANNPVNFVDPTGESILGLLLCLAIGAAIGVASQYVSDVVEDAVAGKSIEEIFTPNSSWVDYVAAGLKGAIAATGIGIVGSSFLNATIDGTAYFINAGISGEDVNAGEFLFIISLSVISSGNGSNYYGQTKSIRMLKKSLKTLVSPKRISSVTGKISTIKSDLIGDVVESFVYPAMDAFLGITDNIKQVIFK